MNNGSTSSIKAAIGDTVKGFTNSDTIAYTEDGILHFYGTLLPVEMIDAWFNGEAAFLDLVSQGAEAAKEWALKNIPHLGNHLPDNLEIEFSDSADTGSATGPNELTDFAHALLIAWEDSVPAPQQIGAAILSTANTASTAFYAPVFSTLIDGSAGEILRDIAFYSMGNIYVTGGTQNFQQIPITPGNDYFDPSGNSSRGSLVPHDVFVQKYDPDGNLLWSTRIGGVNYDRAYGIEVDANGSVYIAGRAGEGFYVTLGSYQESFGGNLSAARNNAYGKQDGFVSKLDAYTGQLDWSTYIGGEAGEIVRNLDVGPDGVIHLAMTYFLSDINQPITDDAMQPNMQSIVDNIYAQLSNDGAELLYGTFVGGNGDVSMIMRTDAVDAPTTAGAFRSTLHGLHDFYLVKFDGATDGRTIKSATYFGTEAADYTETHQLAIDDNGNFIVAVETTDLVLPGSSTGFQSVYADGGSDGFISVISADATTVIGSTYFGGSGRDNIEGVYVTDNGIFVSGTTSSSDLPVTDTSQFGGYHGLSDAFVAQFNHDLSELLYASYVGGSSNDQGRALVVTDNGDILFGGRTASSNFYAKNGFDEKMSGIGAAFLTKIAPAILPPPPEGDILHIEASAKLFQGGAEADVKVNGILIDTIFVDAYRWGNQPDDFYIDTGMDLTASDVIEITYTNDLETAAGNRNLFIHSVDIGGQALDLSTVEYSGAEGQYNLFNDIIFVATNGSVLLSDSPILSPPPPPSHQTGDSVIEVSLNSKYYDGAAQAAIKVDGMVLDIVEATANRWTDNPQTFTIDAGMVLDRSQTVEIEYLNDLQTLEGNRNFFIHELKVDGVNIPLSSAEITSSIGAYNTKNGGLFIGTNGAAVFEGSDLDTGEILTLVATADPYSGPAQANVLVDGNIIDTIEVSADRIHGEKDIFNFNLDPFVTPAGFDTIEIEYINDLEDLGVGDRNFLIDEIFVNGIMLDKSLVSISPGAGAYDSASEMVLLSTDGSAIYDMSLQTAFG